MEKQNKIQEKTITSTELEIKESEQNWLKEELENTKHQEGERLPSFKFEKENVPQIITIEKEDVKQKFSEWQDHENNLTKAIIPVLHDGIKKNWWLNKKNPIYHEILAGLFEGKRMFKVMQTGKNKNTKYIMVSEE